MNDPMLISILVSALIVILAGGFVGTTYTLMTRALERWGRYELCWDFEDPFPQPKIFWTLYGARKYLADMVDETEDVLYICDRKTGKKL